jgi:acyl-CoA synthetase (NDP forming)
MSVENLDKIFQPNSIAVVGASERKGSVGAALMHNLIKRGFAGDIFPINPKHKKLWGKLNDSFANQMPIAGKDGLYFPERCDLHGDSGSLY